MRSDFDVRGNLTGRTKRSGAEVKETKSDGCTDAPGSGFCARFGQDDGELLTSSVRDFENWISGTLKLKALFAERMRPKVEETPRERIDRLFDRYFSEQFPGVPRPVYDPTFKQDRAATGMNFDLDTGKAIGPGYVKVGPLGMVGSDTYLATVLEHEYKGHIEAAERGVHPPSSATLQQKVAFEAALNVADAGFAASLGDFATASYRLDNAEAAISSLGKLSP